MKKNYFRLAFVALAMMTVQAALALDFPYAKTPTDGERYILASRSNPTNFWTRTSWDGAYYLLSLADAQAGGLGVFTAHQAENGSWYFSVGNGTDAETGEPNAETYVGIPFGTDNLNGNLDAPAFWTVEQSDVAGFYLLKAGEGQQNDLTIGGYLHLNNGNQYVVITESTNYWFPDFYGGVEKDEDGAPVIDENGFPIPLNTVSRYWAFISPDVVDSYALKVQLYALLQDIEDNYLGDEDYRQGFQGALDVAMPYYNKEEFTQEDLDAARAIVNAKMNLYKEIQTAIVMLTEGTPSSSLSAAIDAAVKTFNESNDIAALEEALAALKAAEKAYAEGSGDLTPLVTNNSFEDLSSQNGAMTSSVAGAPYGWNVFIKGQQVTTADEVRNAGVTAWHGINNDAEGALDGDYAFGLWTSGVPEYEVSQTLTGLDNGSYTIAAAVMVGANGNGSRRTTQRIFGNLNAKYFGADYEYDESRLDQGEVYGFEGLEEPQTDRLLQEMTVRAFVYDGTLTFGLRTNGDIAAANRETSNGAGGDGWFKLDNFRIYKEGYIQDDALAIYNHFAELYDQLQGEQMQQTVKDQLTALLDGNIGSGSSQEEIIAAIIALKDMYATVQNSVNLYASLLAAIEKGTMALIDYEHSASAFEFGDLLMEAQDMYDEAEAGEEEITAMIQQINEGIEELKATSITFGDITYVLKNPSFEDLSAQGGSVSDGAQPAPFGWTLKVDGEVVETVGGGWCAINHGDNINVELEDGTVIEHQYTDGEHVWGIWNSNMPEVELSQTLKNMPPGTYTVQADVMVQYNWAGDNTTTQRIFGNSYVQMWGTDYAYTELNLPADAVNATELTYAGYVCAAGQEGLDNSDLLHPMKVTFEVGDNGIAIIGFRTNGVNAEGNTFATGGLNGQGWFKVDNFRLSYDSDVLTSVSGVKVQNDGTAVSFYSLDGRLLQAPQRGINIMKTAGKTVKILVK